MALDWEFANKFSAEWISAWNSHDLERILSHYSADVVFHSPGIARVLGKDINVLEGKPRLREYWEKALHLLPQLKFELVDIFLSSDAITISYMNERGKSVAETCLFDKSGKVASSIAAYTK